MIYHADVVSVQENLGELDLRPAVIAISIGQYQAEVTLSDRALQTIQSRLPRPYLNK